MEWTKEKPKEDGIYLVYGEVHGAGSKNRISVLKVMRNATICSADGAFIRLLNMHNCIFSKLDEEAIMENHANVQPERYKLSVKDRFNSCVGGRYRREGNFSAEELRDDILLPAIDEYGAIEISLDGLFGIPHSSLEEVFGGMVRKRGSDVIEKVAVVCEEDPSYSRRAMKFMYEAAQCQVEGK